MEASYYAQETDGHLRCELCPHHCKLASGQTGRCRVRSYRDGVLFADSYAQISSLALDPIEKKPLYHFYPGHKVLSLGSWGCNLRCPFCQNHELAMGRPACESIVPETIVELALNLIPQANIGVAYTYNEPLVGYEFLRDCAELVKCAGLYNVVVTNGYIQSAPLQALLTVTDAMNIDLKCFREDSYRRLGGDLKTVQQNIALSAAHCHVELTTLIVPGFNDQPGEMRALSAWLAALDKRIPLHLSRFFPRHQLNRVEPTSRATLEQLAAIAREYLPMFI